MSRTHRLIKFVNLFVIICCVFIFSHCGSNDREECVFAPDTKPVDFTFERFHDSLTLFRTKAEMVSFLTRQPLIRDYVFRRTEYPNDSVYINEIYSRLNNPHIDTLLSQTKQVFGDGSELRDEFALAFSNLKYYYPDFVAPKVQTVVSGLETDMFVSDTLIIVSLDAFIGKGAKYRPSVYEYQLRKYQKQNIVPSAMMIYGIDGRFNKTDLRDKTVLADMVAYGKAFYFAKHMLPCVPDSIFIWYSTEEINGSRKNQDLIWARLLEDKVLFETSHVVKQKYLSDRPKTLEVGEKCPGRIAQWVGWQIVNKYMDKNTGETLPRLMSNPSAQDIFRKSNYKPMSR
jgi:hypothetical protein